MIFPAHGKEKKRNLVVQIRMSGCKGSEESAALAPWGGKAPAITMHRQTSNNKLEGWMGHQPEQLQIGFTMLNTVDLIGSRSTAGHALRLQPCLASMKTSCWIPHGCWRGTMTYLNINELFYFGRIFMFYCTDCRHNSIFQFSERFSRQPAVTSIYQLVLNGNTNAAGSAARAL